MQNSQSPTPVAAVGLARLDPVLPTECSDGALVQDHTTTVAAAPWTPSIADPEGAARSGKPAFVPERP